MGFTSTAHLSEPTWAQRFSGRWREVAVRILQFACVGLVVLLAAFVLVSHAYALWNGGDEHRECPGEQVTLTT